MQINRDKVFKIGVIAAEISLVILLICSFVFVRSCGVKPKENDKRESCTNGDVRQLTCDAGSSGRIFEICKDKKWEQTFSDCKPPGGECSEVVFNRDVKPIIENKCVSCHPGFDTYDKAKSIADQIIKRVSLPDADVGRMPKAPNDPLQPEEKDMLSGWKEDGLLPECADSEANTNPHLDLEYIEEAIEDDLSNMNSADQQDARYLVVSHISDEKVPRPVLRQFVAAANKSMNSLSAVRNIVNGVAVDEYETVYRFSLRDLKLSAADWKLIEDSEPINLESFTNLGILIKNVTHTRKAWLHVDSFAFQSNQAAQYHAIRDIPQTQNELLNILGVDFVGDQDNFQALFVGFSDSPIALSKDRLLARFDSNDGSVWVTFDSDQDQVAQNNLFQFPLLRSASGNANFLFDASEIIFALPNGLHGYALFDAAGNRQNAAPLNVVQDNVSQFSAEIRNSLSCTRCHSSGFRIAQDQILDHVLENAILFSIEDVENVELLYRDPSPYFSDDNVQYAAALAKIGINVNDADPINVAGDHLRKNKGALEVASMLLLTEEEFIEGLGRSAEARLQVGQLLSGGTVTFAQLIAALPVIIRDLRIGREPIQP